MNDINQLRNVLFDTLEGIKSGKIDVQKAKAINEVSQTIISTAKVEIDYIRASGEGLSTFIAPINPNEKPTPTGGLTVNGNSTVHRLR